MTRYVIALLALSLAAGGAVAQDDAEWVSIFNGENLDGWIVKIAGHELGVNQGDLFRVEDGLLKVCYDEYDKFSGDFGHIFYAEPLSSYNMRIEYRFIGEQVNGGPGWAFRNSGIMVHGQAPQSMAIDQSCPVSIEIQMLGGGGEGERSTGNLCTPGTHVEMDGELKTQHCINSSSKTYHGDQWVTLEIEVRGNESIKHIMDGEVVLEYQKPQLDANDADTKRLIEAGAEMMLSGGSISLQAESHPLEFRKIEIQVLD